MGRAHAGRSWPSVALLLGGMALSLARTVRGPNDWAEAHWLLDYRWGFVKRGLPGQLLTWATDLLGVPVSERVIAAVAWTMLVVFTLALLGVVLRTVRRAGGGLGPVLVAMAFVTSPFAVLTGHLNGYFDHVCLGLGVASIWLVLRGRVVPGTLLQLVALLVHESSILLIWPAFVFACLLRPLPAAERPRSLLLPVVLPMLLAGWIAVVLGSPPPGFAAGYEARLRGSGFVVGGYEASTAWMLTMSLPTMWGLVAEHWRELATRHAVAIALVGPNLLVLLPGIGCHPAVRGHRLATVLATGVVGLPLAMHVVAWDAERIWTYTLFTALMAAWILAEVQPGPVRLPRWLVPAAAAALAVNLLFTVPLLDHAVDRVDLVWRAAAAVLMGLGLILLVRSRQIPSGLNPEGARGWD